MTMTIEASTGLISAEQWSCLDHELFGHWAKHCKSSPFYEEVNDVLVIDEDEIAREKSISLPSVKVEHQPKPAPTPAPAMPAPNANPTPNYHRWFCGRIYQKGNGEYYSVWRVKDRDAAEHYGCYAWSRVFNQWYKTRGYAQGAIKRSLTGNRFLWKAGTEFYVYHVPQRGWMIAYTLHPIETC